MWNKDSNFNYATLTKTKKILENLMLHQVFQCLSLKNPDNEKSFGRFGRFGRLGCLGRLRALKDILHMIVSQGYFLEDVPELLLGVCLGQLWLIWALSPSRLDSS